MIPFVYVQCGLLHTEYGKFNAYPLVYRIWIYHHACCDYNLFPSKKIKYFISTLKIRL